MVEWGGRNPTTDLLWQWLAHYRVREVRCPECDLPYHDIQMNLPGYDPSAPINLCDLCGGDRPVA